jgi:hypothetical protein
MQESPEAPNTPKRPEEHDDWWCFACEVGWASQEVDRRQSKAWCPQCGQQTVEADRVRRGEVVAVTEEEEEVRISATEELSLNEASKAAVEEAGVEVMGTARKLAPDDLMIVRGQFANRAHEKAAIKKLEKALRKHNPKWKGVLLHLPAGMELRQLPAVMVEALYEALLARWDPDLLQQRLAKKKAAETEQEAKKEASHLATAEEVSQHLAKLRAENERAVVEKVQKT